MIGEARRPDFDEWFFALYPDALRLATGIVGDWAVGEEVAAEAFTRALGRWDRIKGLGYRDAWLLRVTTNVAIDVLRRRRPEPMVEPVVDGGGVELRIVVIAALRRLPQRQRQAVVLRYLGQLSEGEVAELLGVSAGAVKTHLRRGLAGLKADPSLVGEEGR